MCFYADDGYPDIWEESTPKANKPHTCCECGGAIPIGAVYFRAESLYEGDWTTFKVCHKCEVWRCKIAIAEIEHGCLRDYWCPVLTLRDVCSESGEYRALEPTAEDLAVSLEEWRERVAAAHRAALERKREHDQAIRMEVR